MVTTVLSGLPEGVVLRPVTEHDTAFLYQLYASTRADEMAMTGWPEQQQAEFLNMQFNAQHSYYRDQFQQASFDIVEHNGEAIGRLYIDRRVDEIRVIDIALLPEQRGHGIGGAIMQAIIDEAAGVNKKVGIHVEHNNPAMHLYVRLGFRPVRDEGVYQFMQWQQE